MYGDEIIKWQNLKRIKPESYLIFNTINAISRNKVRTSQVYLLCITLIVTIDADIFNILNGTLHEKTKVFFVGR